MNFELAKFWTEKIIEIDPTERERPSLGLLLEKMLEIISVPPSDKSSNEDWEAETTCCLRIWEVTETILVPTFPHEPD